VEVLNFTLWIIRRVPGAFLTAGRLSREVKIVCSGYSEEDFGTYFYNFGIWKAK
jgi:hypothetical protein